VDQKTLEVKLCDFGLANLCTIEKALVSVCGTENYGMKKKEKEKDMIVLEL
jgi:hypothetical protein